MNLPVSFDNVPYSEKTFSGDMIVSANALYFFPHGDFEQECLDKYGKEHQGVLDRQASFRFKIR